MTLGGGLDYKLSDRFAIRPVKVDYLMTRFSETGTSNQTQNNLRVSTGIVFGSNADHKIGCPVQAEGPRSRQTRGPLHYPDLAFSARWCKSP